MQYVPQNVPTDVKDIPSYLSNELKSISAAMTQANQLLLLQKSYSAPVKPREGMIALADGTSWNPGSGAGFYGYRGSAWVLLG